jgi:hypothetical protein
LGRDSGSHRGGLAHPPSRALACGITKVEPDLRIGPPGFEFPRVSGHSHFRGATFENGRGQVYGGQPGTPIKLPF